MKDTLMVVGGELSATFWALSPALSELFVCLFLSRIRFYAGVPESDHKVWSYGLSNNQYMLLVLDLPDGGVTLRWRRTGEVFLPPSEELAESLFKRWHEVRSSDAVRILLWAKDNKIYIKGRKRRKGGEISGLASETLNLREPLGNWGGDRSVKTVFKFLQALPEREDAEVLGFIRDKDCRELSIGGFRLRKRVGKVVIKGMDGDRALKEAHVTPREFSKIIPEFRVALATKPEQIGIVRNNRGLVVVTDQTARELLFGK